MDVLPWVFSSGWASGLNGYAVVLLLGLFGRFGGADGVPPALERTDVLLAAAVLTVLELVADKIPYLDSAWDAAHTVIRPAIGAAVGALLAGQAHTLGQAVGAGIGGVTALASHSVKAGIRAAVNTSPEPVTNLAVSSAEDVAVAAVVSLSIAHPLTAAVVAAVLLATGIGTVVWVIRRIRRLHPSRSLGSFRLARRQGRISRGRDTPSPPPYTPTS